MTEQEFWLQLERRVIREFAGMREPSLRHWWCDGLVPEQYETELDPPCVIGKAWIGPDGQGEWQFFLFTDCRLPHPSMKWECLLPSENVTGWLTLDFDDEVMRIDPREGFADPD